MFTLLLGTINNFKFENSMLNNVFGSQVIDLNRESNYSTRF